MAKFLTGKDLENEVYNIIWSAKETLLIVSPYIQLDEYFKKIFDNHLNNPKLHLIIVFRKHESRMNKNFSKNDIEYFKKFLNVSIIYVPNLHAKYYGNENKGIITSINLYDYSFKNNIEFGVFSEVTLLDNFKTTTDQQAWQACWEIAKKHEAIYIKRPVFEKKFLSAIIGKSYIKSNIIHDSTQKIYSSLGSKTTATKTLEDFPTEIILGETSSEMPNRENVEIVNGYCIRTGTKIPFNIKRPYCEQAYKSWAYYKNAEFKEKYCHKTGKESNGKTSMRNPVL
jgi:hypothetical protein